MSHPVKIEWRTIAPVLIAAAVIAVICLLQALPRLHKGLTLFERLEAISYDWRVRQAFADNELVMADLGVVFIDDDSLKFVNDNFRFSWPWPRQLHGRVVNELKAQGAKVIGFDILFRELHPLTAETALLIDDQVVSSDDYFAGSLRSSSNVVLATVGETVDSQWHALMPANKFATNAWKIGHIMGDGGTEGVLRRVKAYYDDPLEGRLWHLAILLAANYLELDMDRAEVYPDRVVLPAKSGPGREIPTDTEGYFYIDWSLRWNDPKIQKERYEMILVQEIARANALTNTPFAWQNKIVIVGSIGTGNNISDVGATPLSKQTYLLSKHWNVANGIVMERFIRRSSYFTETLLIIVMGGLAAALTWRMRALWASFVILLLLVGYFYLALLLYTQSRYWLPVTLPCFGALLMTHVSMVTWRVAVEQKERRRIKSIFSRVVSPNVVNELLRAETISLGGARRRVTVFFADIRGFTAVTDESQAAAEAYVRTHDLPPELAESYLESQSREVLATVNLYLGIVADTIREHCGTFDKYIGDCVMAFWGAPTPNDRHAVDCVLAAIDAQKAIYQLNQQRVEENRLREQENVRRIEQGQPPLSVLTLLTLGSGINTGTVTVGLMGSHAHILNYTIFGREVNLASRLEGLSGRGRILISESTYRELQKLEPSIAKVCEALPAVTVKGIRERLTTYEVQWRQLEGSARSYDTGILTGAALSRRKIP